MSNEQEYENVWAHKEALPHVSVKWQIAAAIVCFLCALAIPFCSSFFVSLAVMVLLSVYTAIASRSPWAVFLLLVTAFSASFFTLNLSVGAVVMSVIVGVAVCAFLLTTLKRAYFVCLPFLLACGITFLLRFDYRPALLPLVVLPAALLVAVATVKAKGKTSSVCFATAGLLLSVVAIVGVLIWQQYGSLGQNAIAEYFGGLRDGFIRDLLSVRDELLEIAGQDGSEQAQLLQQQISKLMSDDTVTDMIAQLFNILPALVVMLCSVLAYEAHALLNSFYRSSGLQCVLTREACVLTISPTAAVIYAVTFILVLVLPSSTVFSATVQNLCLILMPGLCLVGVRGLFTALSKARGGMRVFFIFALAFLFCCYAGGVLYILAMWGAYYTITLFIRNKMIEKMKEKGDFDQNQDDGHGDS